MTTEKLKHIEIKAKKYRLNDKYGVLTEYKNSHSCSGVSPYSVSRFTDVNSAVVLSNVGQCQRFPDVFKLSVSYFGPSYLRWWLTTSVAEKAFEIRFVNGAIGWH